MALKSFIDEEKIESILSGQSDPDRGFVRETLEQAQSIDHKGLTLEQTAALLQNRDPELEDEIFRIAREIKKRIYGNRIVLFAPLYISNTCINNCVYCGFRADNKDLVRKVLNAGEIREEVAILEKMGHKRLLLVYGEGSYTPEWVAETIAECYSVKTAPHGEIRRINVNMAPMDVEGFKVVKAAQIGTFQCFQETYHRPTYGRMHLSGPKSDYLFRLYCMHRAMEAGIDDVGMGALFGLYDHKFELLALLRHCRQLEQDFGVGPHTLSFPRIEPAQGSDLSYSPPYAVTEEQLKKLVAVTRIAVPYTGMIMSTRERAEVRNELLEYGISQISAASRVYPGSYRAQATNREDTQQFFVADDRSLDRVIYDMLTDLEYIPSFCTGCYRKGRTGDHFMGYAKTAFINKFCTPNGILTFAEYLRDYAGPETRDAGERLIAKLMTEDSGVACIGNELSQIRAGANDLYL